MDSTLGGIVIVVALAFSIIIAAGSFVLGVSGAGYGNLSGWIVAVGVFWLTAQWRTWRWVSTLAVILAFLLAAIGVWFDFVIGWMFSGATFSLIAWDLTNFQHTLSFANAREDIPGMARRHIARISLLALAGMLGATLLMYVRGQFTAEWGVFLGIVVVLVFFQTAAWRRK